MKNSYSIDRFDFGDVTLDLRTNFIRFSIQKGQEKNYLVTTSTTIENRLNTEVDEQITSYFVVQLDQDKIFKIDKPIRSGDVIEGIPTEVNRFESKQKILSVLPDYSVNGPNVYDIFLLWGQSNTVGANGGPIDEAGLDAPDLNVWQIVSDDDYGVPNYDFGNKFDIIQARLPLAFQQQVVMNTPPYAEADGTVKHVSWGLEFGKTYSRLTGRTALLVPVALNASHFGETGAAPVWGEANPNQPNERTTDAALFGEALNLVNSAISQGHRFQGIIFSQGVSDIAELLLVPGVVTDGEDTRLWASRLARQITAWKDRIIDDVNGAHWDVPTICISAPNDALPGETLAPSGNALINAQTMRNSQIEISHYVPYSTFIDGSTFATDNLEGLNIHFNAESMREIGRQAGELMASGVENKITASIIARNGGIFDEVGGGFTVFGNEDATITQVVDDIRGDVLQWSGSTLPPVEPNGKAILLNQTLNRSQYTKILWFRGSLAGIGAVAIASGDPGQSHFLSLLNGTTLLAGHDESNVAITETGFTFGDGNWHYIAVAYDGTNIYGQVDSTVISPVAELVPVESNDIVIGGLSDDGAYQTVVAGFQDGNKIGGVKILNYAMTPSEILNYWFRTNLF